ncbi:hypothetical protein PSTG_03729 [Puccinia striiformis f. sp. tritici PST-78]|uniref:Uncharacterized protein n=1 Tax=Puccinia striiformis f. sp. tritici PST-78 TaxID=1165861 RepID=A0A0L0VV18_9BASI|nr:hypothetical protein PSTG_03729 [Puccinia striiformis f. sp. tritici PST-78]
MAEELWELGGMTGLLKDKVVELNGKVINSFSSVAHEDVSMLNCVWKFSRVAQVIQLVSDGKTSYSINTVEKNFQLAFSNFNWELKRLIDSIDNSIPPASRAANLGLQVSERIHKEHYKLKMFRDDQPLCRKLLHQTNKSGKQLKRDVQLTARSIQTARALHTGLEEIQSDLLVDVTRWCVMLQTSDVSWPFSQSHSLLVKEDRSSDQKCERVTVDLRALIAMCEDISEKK